MYFSVVKNMPNYCVAYGCRNGAKLVKNSKKKTDENIGSFKFPNVEKKPQLKELNEKWVKFVNRKDENNKLWKPDKDSVLCEEHFEQKYIKTGTRKTLNWQLNPIPTFQSKNAPKRQSLEPTIDQLRKPPKIRYQQEDELKKYKDKWLVETFEQIDEKNHCPENFQYKETDEYKLFYRLEFDPETSFPHIFESIRINKNLNVKLQYNGVPLPLPSWFISGRNAKIKDMATLGNFSEYMRSCSENSKNNILDELNQRKHFKRQAPFSAEIIRYSLLLKYTSKQTYLQLLKKFALPSISLLNRIQKGGVDSIKAIKHLCGIGEISKDIILMFDEMYLQKEVQYSGGALLGLDKDESLYKGIVTFMIVGLKKSVPYVVKACPEVKINGQWLFQEISQIFETLAEAGFNVRGLVCDNHSANVRAFKLLSEKFSSDPNSLFIQHPKNKTKTYMFFDNVHLLKNIRNNLLNAKKIVFNEFHAQVSKDLNIKFPAGYITWADLHKVYDFDSKLPANLKKAHKLSYSALHPGNNKQNVKLALAIFDEATIAAIRSYFPDRTDFAGFLELWQKWWTIVNSDSLYHKNKLAHAFVNGDEKTDFLRTLADWLESWSICPNFSLTFETNAALVKTLRSQASLIDELLSEDYKFVIPRKLQSDPLERRYSQYRQMGGGRFLVGLREVNQSERILACRSLLKEGVFFWKENLAPENDFNQENFFEKVKSHESNLANISLCADSREVAAAVAGYIAKKMIENSKCVACKSIFFSDDFSIFDKKCFLEIYSRGGLTIPSANLWEFVCEAFSTLDYFDKIILKFPGITEKNAALIVLDLFLLSAKFVCESENCEKWAKNYAQKAIVNTFYNNKSKILTDNVRKDQLKKFKKRQRSKSE